MKTFVSRAVGTWEAGKYGERLCMSRPTYPPFQRSSDAVSSGGFAGGYESIHLSPSPIVSLAVDVLRIHASTSRCGFRLCAREVSKVLSHSSPPFLLAGMTAKDTYILSSVFFLVKFNFSKFLRRQSNEQQRKGNHREDGKHL